MTECCVLNVTNMASNSDDCSNVGSDVIHDFSCDTCKEEGLDNQANFCCKKCSKFYCNNCMETHKSSKKHKLLGRKALKKWPVARATEDASEQCQEHKGKKLELFCEDHDQLICIACHMYNHKNCSETVMIADKVKALQKTGDFKLLTANVDTLHKQLIKKKHDFKKSMQSLEKSYDTILNEINTLGKKINDCLNRLKMNTISKLKKELEAIRTAIQKDINNCTEVIYKMNRLQNERHGLKKKSETQYFIMYNNFLYQTRQTESMLQDMSTKSEVTIAFQPDTSIEQTLSALLELGNILSNMQQPPTVTSTKQDATATQARPQAYDQVSGSSSQPNHENQTNAVNKPGHVANPVSSSSSQPDDENQTSAVYKPDATATQARPQAYDQVSGSSRQPDHENQAHAVNKPGTRSNPVSSSSSQPHPEKISAVNESSLVPNPVSGSSTQTDTGNQSSSLVNKPGLVSNPVSGPKTTMDTGNQTNDVNKPGHVSHSNQLIRVESKMQHKVKMGDKYICWISGIHETTSGELLLTDRTNKKVKLLDKDYKVVAHCDLPDTPWSMCSIDSGQVAVAVDEIIFISVSKGQLVEGRKLELGHACRGIAHHQGNLYITSGTALYHYTVDGRLVSQLYKDKSVSSCAVSPDGDRIYVANKDWGKLVTLSTAGTVISTLTDHALQWVGSVLPGLHVTDLGQVLVCGGKSNTILQVDRDGRRRLAEVVTEKGGVSSPTSVYYSKHTGSLIVGMQVDDNILAFKTKQMF